MNSNCAVRNLDSDFLLQKIEINLWGGGDMVLSYISFRK